MISLLKWVMLIMTPAPAAVEPVLVPLDTVHQANNEQKRHQDSRLSSVYLWDAVVLCSRVVWLLMQPTSIRLQVKLSYGCWRSQTKWLKSSSSSIILLRDPIDPSTGAKANLFRSKAVPMNVSNENDDDDDDDSDDKNSLNIVSKQSQARTSHLPLAQGDL